MLELGHLTQQEQISFLEGYIREINRTLDELTEGHDIPKELKSMKLRIEVLEREDPKKYENRLIALRNELSLLEKNWKEKEPIIRLLEDERSLYRNVLNSI